MLKELSGLNKMSKPILIISEVFFPEDSLINDLAFVWKEKGYDVHVLTRNPSYPYGKVFNGYKNKWFQKELLNGILIYRVKVIEGYKESQLIKVVNYIVNMIIASIWIIFNSKKYKIIFIHHTGPLTFSVSGSIASRLYKNRTSIWTMDVWPDSVYAYGLAKKRWLSYLLEKFVGFVYNGIDNIIVTSPGFSNSVKKYSKNKNVFVIPQWSITNFGSESSIVLPGKFNFVFAGNIGKAQNLENVVLGFSKSKLAIKNNDVYLSIVGDGSSFEKLKYLVQEKRIRNVKFWGRRPMKEMPSFYSATSVLVISLEDIPILNKTIPAKFQSYIAAGKPLLGIINGEVKRLIEENNIGYVANPNDVIDIGKTFDKFINADVNKLNQFANNGIKLSQNEFSRKVSINKLSNIIFGDD